MLIGAPSETPMTAARWDPTASMTARTSSIRTSSGESAGTASDMPVPRLSKTISRANEAMRSKRAQEGNGPRKLDVRGRPGNEDDVERPVAGDPVGDVDVAAARVAD